MNDRIKLAKAMNLTMPECGSCFGSGRITVSPTFGSEMCTQCEGEGKDWPDPFTDANDCEALIRHINSLGWSVVVDWQHDDPKHAPGVWIEFYHFETEIHERIQGMDRDRWKQGVCELALKVIATEQEGET